LAGFRILGPLEVRGPEGPMAIAGRHHPRLLALLLVEANRVVPSERLAAGLWDGDAPSTAARQLQNIAAALRRRLGPYGERLQKVGAGYRIEVADDELDLLRCRRREADAKAHREAGRPAEAEAALDEALAEWRGPALAGIPGAAVAEVARRLEEGRLALAEERAEIGLLLGRHEHLVRELRRLHLEHPHHQRFAEYLMLALYRCGRGPEALRVYAGFSARLAEDLGADPGAPLRELHTAVLREDPRLLFEAPEPVAVVPMTLPSGTAAFTGRVAFLERLDAAADAADRPLVVLSGSGGTGKTMLALHWGHRTHRFPGGRIYLDLRGFTPGGIALEPDEAVRRLLGSLGVEAARIPSDADAQLGLYRTLIGAERRLLILDNARDAEQVRPLLPDGTRVHTLVISRRRLVGLAVSHGAEVVEVGALDHADARALLARHVGADRIAADPEAAQQILDACAGLPLALAITGAKTAAQPGLALRAVADELAASRLDALAVGEASVDLRSVCSWSFHSLDPDAARLFRLLALNPGPDFDAAAAARLHGGPEAAAARALAALVDAHLIERDGSGRHRFHDLVRLYAVEQLETADPSESEERDAALDRLLDWYLGRADACRSLLYPAMVGLPVPATPGPALSADEAARWLRTEWENLIAAAELGAAPDARPATRQFAWLAADVVRGYAWLHMLGGDGVRLSAAALDAATAAADPLGQAAAALALACALIRSNRLDEAITHARDAAAFARRADWPAGVASAEGNLGIACYYRGRMREGLEHAYAALHAYRAIGEHRAETTNLHWLGLFHSLLGELATGADYLDRALKLAADAGNTPVAAVIHTHAAEIQLFRGRIDLAAAHLAEAAALQGVSVDRTSDLPGVTARLDLAAGRTEQALAQAKRVVAERADAVHHRIRAAAMVTLAAAHAGAGEHDAALAAYDDVLAMTEHEATVFHRVEALTGRAAAILHGGDPAGAATAAATALRTARDGGYRFLEGRALNVSAEAALVSGRNADAERRARQALALHQETGHRPGEADSLRLLARCACAAGDPEASRRLDSEARALYADIGAPIPDDGPEQGPQRT